jgi:hypothetical protein
MSCANRSFNEDSVIALPPYLITMVLPRKVRMYGKASMSTLAFRINLFIVGSPEGRLPHCQARP